MERTAYKTKADVLSKAEQIKGIPLREIDLTGRLNTGKGAIGTVIEESWFGYLPNSESEPDFPEAGVELKVTPYVKGAKGIRAKERLVCNIINYMEEYRKTFLTSSFWHKCKTLLLMSYEHKYDVPKGDYKIDETILFSFPEEDLVIIEQDWAKIITKVRAGLAHEISEGDTLYLAACTKGADSTSVREQPFSEIMAKQRAYSLKASYMTQVLNKYVFGSVENPKIIRRSADLREQSFEEYITDKIKPFYGKTQSELKKTLGVTSDSKNINELLLAKMLGVDGKIANTEEFKKAAIIPKTIRVQKNGRIKESMSFPYFDFIRLSKEESWEDSEFYNYIAPAKFMFVIFTENKDGEYVFNRIKFWNMPPADLEEVGRVWTKARDTIRRGITFTVTPRGVCNDLPKQTESRVSHVRPHARNADDALLLPDGRTMPKQCFWLNNSYIEEQIKD